MPREICAEDARKRIEPGWNQLLKLLDGIPADRVEEPGVNGDWSVKVLIGHIAYWEQNAARVIQIMAGGQKPPPIDFNAINAEVAATDATRPYADVRRELEDAHNALLALLDQTGSVGENRLAGDTWGHYPEHIKQLEEWRLKTGI